MNKTFFLPGSKMFPPHLITCSWCAASPTWGLFHGLCQAWRGRKGPYLFGNNLFLLYFIICCNRILSDDLSRDMFLEGWLKFSQTAVCPKAFWIYQKWAPVGSGFSSQFSHCREAVWLTFVIHSLEIIFMWHLLLNLCPLTFLSATILTLLTGSSASLMWKAFGFFVRSCEKIS